MTASGGSRAMRRSLLALDASRVTPDPASSPTGAGQPFAVVCPRADTPARSAVHHSTLRIVRPRCMSGPALQEGCQSGRVLVTYGQYITAPGSTGLTHRTDARWRERVTRIVARCGWLPRLRKLSRSPGNADWRIPCIVFDQSRPCWLPVRACSGPARHSLRSQQLDVDRRVLLEGRDASAGRSGVETSRSQFRLNTSPVSSKIVVPFFCPRRTR